MRNIKHSLKRLNISKIPRKNIILYGAVFLVVMALGAFGFYLNSTQNKTPNDPKEVVAFLAKLDKEPDCNKSLERLSAVPIEGLTDKDGKKTESVEKIYYYRIHCNNSLENYGGALAVAKELRAYYEKNNADAAKKSQADQMIQSIITTEQTLRQEAENSKNQGPPVENNEPLL